MTEDKAYWEAKARRYEEVHDRSPDGMMIFRAVRDDAGSIVDFEWLYCNASASQIVGRKADELLGKRLLVEMPGNREAGLFDIYVRVVELSEPHSHEFSYRYETLDHWFRATSIKLGDGFYVAFSDLTDRKRAEEQAARLAAIVRSSEHAIYSISNTGEVETWNQGAESLYGYSSAEMVGQSVLAIIPEECREEHEDALRGARERGGVDSFQTVRVTKTGHLAHVSLMLSPIRDLDNQSIGTAIIARDVTDQVKLQERLIATDRMASVGTLAAGMAHEINNPLACVTANLDVAIEDLQGISSGARGGRLRELETMMAQARDGAERIRKIVRGLMTFSRADEERRAVIEVRPVLELAVNMAFHEICHRARLVKIYGPVPRVVADDARLAQVFISLLVNAAQAAGDGDADAHELRITTSTDDVGRAVIEIRDTGPGIPTDVIKRVFDPFFTTRAIGVGAGLGLSIARNIVKGMGGEISVWNNEDRGATFHVTLPAGPEVVAQPVDPATEIGLPPLRRGEVLIVDDEPAVGMILGRILQDHDVTVVSKARQALGLVVAGRHFDVILSDLMMPEMTGMELYDEIARHHPRVAERIVFVTGGVFTPGASEFLDRVSNRRLNKPFDTKSVRALVQKLVAE